MCVANSIKSANENDTGPEVSRYAVNFLEGAPDIKAGSGGYRGQEASREISRRLLQFEAAERISNRAAIILAETFDEMTDARPRFGNRGNG